MSAERTLGAAPDAGLDAGPAEQVTTHSRTQPAPGAQPVQAEDASLVRGDIAPGLTVMIRIHVRIVIRLGLIVESVQKTKEELS